MSPAQPNPFLQPIPTGTGLWSGQFTAGPGADPLPVPASVSGSIRLENLGPARVYVGTSSVAPTNGYTLDPGDKESFATTDLHVCVDVGNQARLGWYG